MLPMFKDMPARLQVTKNWMLFFFQISQRIINIPINYLCVLFDFSFFPRLIKILQSFCVFLKKFSADYKYPKAFERPWETLVSVSFFFPQVILSYQYSFAEDYLSHFILPCNLCPPFRLFSHLIQLVHPLREQLGIRWLQPM